MLTENEVRQLLEINAVRESVQQLRLSFVQEETEFSEISLHDFLSGVLLAPSIALAQVDGVTSLFEELSLNKKARRFSKGGFFLRHDPVVRMVIHLQTHFEQWESRFFNSLHRILQAVVPEITSGTKKLTNQVEGSFMTVMNSSYILIKLLETFFLPEGEEITNKRRVSDLEYQKIIMIGEQLQLSEIDSFGNFIKTFEVK